MAPHLLPTLPPWRQPGGGGGPVLVQEAPQGKEKVVLAILLQKKIEVDHPPTPTHPLLWAESVSRDDLLLVFFFACWLLLDDEF